MCELNLVNNVNEIRENIVCFNEEAPGNLDRARNLLRSTTYWLYDEEREIFGPSKFVGFQEMTFNHYNNHAENVRIRNSPGRFQGGNTRRANKRALNQEFVQDTQLANDLVNWGNNLLNQDIFENINRDKWRFIRIPQA